MTNDYNAFALKCYFLEGIPFDILKACEPFVLENMRPFQHGAIPPAIHDLGYAELGDITDSLYSIKRIKGSINQSIMDYDKLGRPLHKVRYRQLVKNPHRGLKRIVLKSFFLNHFGITEPEPIIDSIDAEFDRMWIDQDIMV
jgi:hypothetical protein